MFCVGVSPCRLTYVHKHVEARRQPCLPFFWSHPPFFVLFLFPCGYACVCVCVHVCSHVLCKPEMDSMCPPWSLFTDLRHSLRLNLELTISSRLVGQQASRHQGSACLSLQLSVLRLQTQATVSGFTWVTEHLPRPSLVT